jgi:hypothetical protein
MLPVFDPNEATNTTFHAGALSVNPGVSPLEVKVFWMKRAGFDGLV